MKNLKNKNQKKLKINFLKISKNKKTYPNRKRILRVDVHALLAQLELLECGGTRRFGCVQPNHQHLAGCDVEFGATKKLNFFNF